MELEISNFAWIGDAILRKPVKGIVLNFHGLGYSQMKEKPDLEDLELADAGALNVYPYYGPWSWMNREARQGVHALIDRVYAEFGLEDGSFG